jgi:hypothetical protein
MSEATPAPEDWHGAVSEGRHKATAEKVTRFTDAFWQWHRDNDSGDFGADLLRFGTEYRDAPSVISGSYRGRRIRATEALDRR